MTCVAENSSGYQFPVTEDGYYGWDYQRFINQIEEAAIDRCYAETHGDESCTLIGCEAGY